MANLKEVKKHTPGPWSWVGGMLVAGKFSEAGHNEIVLWPRNALSGDDDEFSRSELMGACGQKTETQADANARLISAAPELLEALEHMVAVSNWATTIQSEEQYDAMIASAEAAIWKAKGGQ